MLCLAVWYMLQLQWYHLGVVHKFLNKSYTQVKIIKGQVFQLFHHIRHSVSIECDVLRLSVPSTLSRSELIISTKTMMKTWLPTDVLDHVCVCASASRDNKSRQSKRIGRGERGMPGGLGLRMWEGGRGKTRSQLSARCTHIWFSVLVALC